MQASDALDVFGVHLVGATAENGRKLLLTLALIALVIAATWAIRQVIGVSRKGTGSRVRFWARQLVSILAGVLLLVGITSIWFDDPTRLTTALGLVTAGLAFALQRVITATAGYFVILRGKTFNIGDRIVMGGVRGDVVGLTFMQTKIMEMGQPPSVSSAEPPMWIYGRQFTGRIVTVSNDKIFDEPVYNYTYHFPFVWEEIRLPISYRDDRSEAEAILLEAGDRHATTVARLSDEEQRQLERRYGISLGDVQPRVYWRITDNWLELTLRFLTPDHGARSIKDAMTREILAQLDEAGIGIASATFEITALPHLQIGALDESG